MKTVTAFAILGMLSLVLAAAAGADGVLGSGSQVGLGPGHRIGLGSGAGSRVNASFQHHRASQHPGRFQPRGRIYSGCCWGGAYYGWPVGPLMVAPTYSAEPAPYPVYAGPVYVAVPTPAWEPQRQVYLAPPAPAEQCYAGGCYRLQGDGMSAFRWVWFPAAPEAPPAPPAASAPVTQAPDAQVPADPAPSRSNQSLFRWVDDQGITHWTNKRETVPEPYRARVEQRTL